jgi:hypothetical protein
LLNNEDAKKKLLGVFVQDVYKTLRTDKSDWGIWPLAYDIIVRH